MFARSLRTPTNTAELSNAKEEVSNAEKLPSRLLFESKAEIKAVNSKVSSTASWTPAPAIGVAKLNVSGPGLPGEGN